MLIPPLIPQPLAFHTLMQQTGHTNDLARATAARNRVRTVLKANAKQPATADWTAAVKAITDYLPYLYAILKCVEQDDLLLKQEPVFVWRSSLSSQPLKKSNQLVSLPSFHYELVATLLTYAICLSNAAFVLIQSLGSYEISSSVSSSAIKAHDETVNQAAESLSRAAGICDKLSEEMIPRWELTAGETIRGRPIEFGREFSSALAKSFLADANLLAIRRLLSRSLSVAHSTTTPGPPLAGNHPSPSLLAKLHLNVHSLYDTARSLLKPPSSSLALSGEISPLLRRYLSDGRLLSFAIAYKWLGVDAGENGGREKAGESLGWLNMAEATLQQLAEKSKGLNALKINKGKSAAKGRKGKIQEEFDSISAFTRAYKKVNDTVHFQPIPSPASLLPRVPAGRAALNLKTFSEPTPAFKPGTRDATEQLSGGPYLSPPPLSVDGTLDLSHLDLDAESGDEADQADYFGAGQYF